MEVKGELNAQKNPPPPREIEFLSKSIPVSMADEYFNLATLDHFWIKRRFEVLRKIAGHYLSQASELAEIGCGHGLLQRMIEDMTGTSVDGFDLNVYALERNISRRSRVACYNVLDASPDLASRYQLLLLFDVLEHIEREGEFLIAIKHLLKRGGLLIINVPAGKCFHSVYDDMDGHLRRYSPSALLRTVTDNGFKLVDWTYWGFPFIPLLLLRKLALTNTSRERVIRRGFSPPGQFWNKLLTAASCAEIIPQRIFGTSIMGVFEKTQ
jgi:SAM-dependent methyltransferase